MRVFTLTILGAALATPLAAQDHDCSGASTQQIMQACQTAIDAMTAFHPLAGIAISGGNPVLGQAASLGGAGHLALTARVNVIKVALPNPDSASQDTVPLGYNTVLPAPVMEAALGLYRGLGGDGGLLSIDALGSAVVLPTGQVANLSVDSNATHVGSVALGLGYGLRVGLLKGALLIPAVSLSVMRRHLPRLQYGDITAGNPSDFAMDLDATNIRVTAGMHLLLFDVAAGLGTDSYHSNAQVRYKNGLLAPRTVDFGISGTRQVLFADAGMNFLLLKVVGELGFQTGTDQSFQTVFSGFDPKAGHVFGGIGARFSF